MSHNSTTTPEQYTEHTQPTKPGQEEVTQPAVSAPSQALTTDSRIGFVSFIFHGMFSFIVDSQHKTIKAAAPSVHEHCYAIRAATPLRVGPGWSSPIFLLPHGFVAVSFLTHPTSAGLPPREHVLVLPGEEAAPGTRWSFQGNDYFCLDLPFPTEYGFCRTTTTTTKLFDNSGKDVPADDKENGKKYAIVVRFTYDIPSSDVRIRLPFPYGVEFDILSG